MFVMLKKGTTIVLLAFLLLGLFGCTEQVNYDGTNTVSIVTKKVTDLDNDGIADIHKYEFSSNTWPSIDYKFKKEMAVAVKTTSTYKSYNNVTDWDQIRLEEHLDDFEKNMKTSDADCAEEIGLLNTICVDPKSCVTLCSGASLQCKELVKKHETVVAGSMINYVKEQNELKNGLNNLKRTITRKTLRGMDKNDKDTYLNDIKEIIYDIALVNLNPLYAEPNINLCKEDNYGAEYLVNVANVIGKYNTKEDSYKYLIGVVVTAKDASAITDFAVVDWIPADIVTNPSSIKSQQSIKATKHGNDYKIEWQAPKVSKEGYLLVYEFESTYSPSEVIFKLKGSGGTVKVMDLVFLEPTKFIFYLLHSITNNYYASLGFALSITIIVLHLLYNLLIIAYSVLRAIIGKEKPMMGIRKAIGKVEVRWTTDLVLGMILLLVGLYVAFSVATSPKTIPGVFETIDTLANNITGVIAVALSFIGLLLLYLATENRLKIFLLEKAYGVAIKEDKDVYMTRVQKLKEARKDLEELIKTYTKDEFDISSEYDVFASVSDDRISDLAKEMNPRNKKQCEDYLTRVEGAVEQLHERKKTADQNWDKWKSMIDKAMEEKKEVYISSLITIPASLRNWAVGRYVKERAAEGIVRDHDVIVKRKVDPTKVVGSMIKRGLISTVVAIKDDKIAFAKTNKGTGTIQKVFALKIMEYLKTVGRNLGQSDWKSFAAAGEKNVVVLLKDAGLVSMLIVPREKFNEAVSEYKSKAKGLVGTSE